MATTSFHTIGVIGAGAWGSALAGAAARAGRSVVLHVRRAAVREAIAATGETPRLPGIRLAPEIAVTGDIAQAGRCDVVLLAAPAQALREAAAVLAPHLVPGTPVVACAKGIERGSRRFMTEVIADAAPQAAPAVLSGPGFAEDVARGLPTAVTLAAHDERRAAALAEALGSATFRPYHTTDMRGVEIGGAAKNVLAIAAGIAIGLGYGESARAALVARGFSELRRFGEAFGAQSETLMGLSGLGDVVLSCASAQSRNFAYGLALGQGSTPAEAAGGKLAEGAFTAAILAEMARARGIETPIAEAVAAIIAGKIGVREAVAGLLARPIRSEN